MYLYESFSINWKCLCLTEEYAMWKAKCLSRTTLLRVIEDRSSQLRRCGSLKSR